MAFAVALIKICIHPFLLIVLSFPKLVLGETTIVYVCSIIGIPEDWKGENSSCTRIDCMDESKDV